MMEIFCAMSFMAWTVCETDCPAWLASSAALVAIFSVWRALSVFCWMAAEDCSMEAETCSTEAACSEEPVESVWAVLVISSEPAETFSAAERTLATMSRRFETIFCSARPRVSLSEASWTS